jgi:membrane protein
MTLRFDRDRALTFCRFLWQRFLDDKCFETAGALSYTTLVSLVPLMVAVLAMLSVLPVFPQLENARETLVDFVFRHFVPAAGERIQQALLDFADNASKLTWISLLVMFFSAVSMMVSIEDQLNRIWRVNESRGWAPRVLLYLVALTLGPILVVGGVALTSYITALPLLQDTAGQLGLSDRVLRGLPFVITFVTLWLLYTLVPNQHVSRRDATIGALLGAVLFEIVRWGFRLFVHNAHTYQQIYGALAAIPIFLLWIYLSWTIVILGASITASISSFDYRPPAKLLPDGAEFLGLLLVLRHLVDAQRAGRSVSQASLQLSEPMLHGDAIAEYLEELAQAELVKRDESGGWLLRRSSDSTDLTHIYCHTRYRLPLEPVEEAAALGVKLPPALLALLDALADSLETKLGTRLDQIFPPDADDAAVIKDLPA